MRPIVTDRCLPTLIFISAREEETGNFLSILRITLQAWVLPNLHRRRSLWVSLGFMVLCSQADTTRQSSGTSVGNSNLKPWGQNGDPGLHDSFCRTTSQEENKSHMPTLTGARSATEARLSTVMRRLWWDVFFDSCKLAPHAHIIDHRTLQQAISCTMAVQEKGGGWFQNGRFEQRSFVRVSHVFMCVLILLQCILGLGTNCFRAETQPTSHKPWAPGQIRCLSLAPALITLQWVALPYRHFTSAVPHLSVLHWSDRVCQLNKR